MSLDNWKARKLLSLDEAALLINGGDPSDARADPFGCPAPDEALLSTMKEAILLGDLPAFLKDTRIAKDSIKELYEMNLFEGKGTEWRGVQIHKPDLIGWLETTELRPSFFFPNAKIQSSTGGSNEQKKSLPDELKAWLLNDRFSLHEATSLAVGVNPECINSSEGIGYTAIETALKRAITNNQLPATIGEIACRPSNQMSYDQWQKMELLKSDLTKWFASREYKVDFFSLGEDCKPRAIAEGAYITPKIKLVNDAVGHFWQGVDPRDKRAPTNQNVKDWLNDEAKTRDIKWSDRMGESVATIIRHPDKP